MCYRTYNSSALANLPAMNKPSVFHHFHAIQDLFLAARCAREPKDEVDNDGSEQEEGQDGGTEAVIEALLPTHPNAPCSPMELIQCVYHGAHGNNSEYASADLAHFVAEVEQPDCQAAQDDGEVEP